MLLGSSRSHRAGSTTPEAGRVRPNGTRPQWNELHVPSRARRRPGRRSLPFDDGTMPNDAGAGTAMAGDDELPETDFGAFRESFYYGAHADMQFKFLAKMTDADAQALIADVLAGLGEAFDTDDLGPLRERVRSAQQQAYADEAAPQVDDAPFTRFEGELREARLLLVSAGGVFRVDDDPMGPDGPTQRESLGLIKTFLRGAPSLSSIPVDTPDDQLTARHPGYDATTAQRDPGSVFPLAVLRELADQGRVSLAETHYAFAGATSQSRLRKEVAPAWAERFVAEEVDGCLLVAT
jgi:hypothetical protein